MANKPLVTLLKLPIKDLINHKASGQSLFGRKAGCGESGQRQPL